MGGFLASLFLLRKIFAKEDAPLQLVDQLFGYVFVGTLIGARLGHVLFYEPQKYFAHPLEIFAVWHGGLASHGGAIGIVLSLLIFMRRHPELSLLWVVDRIAVVVPLAGAFIRFGNLMNSEIIGKSTNLPWAMTFTRIDTQPRHPAQVYEALCYLAISGLLFALYSSRKSLPGYLIGSMLVLIFSVRFFIEFVKENQVGFESTLPINMGQILSLPFIFVGICLVIRACTNGQISRVGEDLKLKGIL
jgi:prolipoprotein diacylglyceryl transferase